VKESGDAGVGNYGLSDQRTALEWIQRNIREFGGDATNVTLFGEGTGAADVLHHVHAAHGLFHRAIAQSPLGAPDADVASVHGAGWQLGKVGGALDALLDAPAADLVRLAPRYPVRAVDDPGFFPTGWRGAMVRASPARVPVLLGESSFAHLPWAENVAEWTEAMLCKRVGAIAQSRARAGALIRKYELSAPTIPEELPERVLDLVGDARFAWPVEAAARRLRAAGADVYRYTWDQEAPDHVAKVAHVPGDLAYLFDNLPAPASDSPFDIAVFDDADDEELAESILSRMSTRSNSTSSSFSLWDAPPPVDRWSFAHVRDTLQERWLAFAHGAAPWAEDGVFVFGPEGECGLRSRAVFEGRRRVRVWEETLAPLEMEVVQKLGVELSHGPCP
jgi:carboxylesterase type B